MASTKPAESRADCASLGDVSHFRRTARAKVQLRAELRRGRRDAALARSGDIVDLSVGGAYIASKAGGQPALGDELWLRIVAPTAWEPLELVSEVRWVEEGGFGVRFTATSESEAAALLALVEMAGYAEEIEASEGPVLGADPVPTPDGERA